MLQVFHVDVTGVSSGCCKTVFQADVAVFHLHVSSVSDASSGCYKSMFQADVANISIFFINLLTVKKVDLG
jgi:hypothetical protein